MDVHTCILVACAVVRPVGFRAWGHPAPRTGPGVPCAQNLLTSFEVSVRRSVLVAVLLFSVGCQRTPAQSQTSSATPAKGATPGAAPAAGQTPGQAAAGEPAPVPVKPVPAQLPEVLCKFNGETVTKAEFESTIRQIEGRVQRPVPPEQRDQVYRQVLDELIDMKLVAAEGKARNVTVTDAEVDTQVAQITKQFPNQADFEKALTARGMTLDKLKADTKNQMLISKTLEAEILPKVQVQQTELETFYKENPDRFKQPERVRASHILFSFDSKITDPVLKEAEKKDLRATAAGVLKRAKAGEDFAALAKQYSKDGSAQNGGDLNYFPRGQMVPAFEQAAFTLKPGEISELVETPFGFHIIKVADHKTESLVPLAEVTPQLTDYLKQQKQRDLMKQFIASLRTKYKVEVLI